MFEGKFGVRWQRVRNEPGDTAFLQELCGTNMYVLNAKRGQS
ncbi:MAG: hypothetical protein ACI9OU_001458 [Candidatus Promineifilaceae bacterium]|jgi:hypothetical protein